MRALPTLSACLALLALPMLAQAAEKPSKHHKAAGPHAIGTFEDWTAATNKEAGQTVCYAFTRARHSSPDLPGRGDVVFTVTERASGRDAVAISVGFPFAANATARLMVDKHSFDLYTAQRSAFAREGHAAVKAMERGHEVTAHLPGPKGAEITDTFSLRGFDKAYAAIVKRCPPGKPAA